MSVNRFVHIGDTHLQSTHPRNAERLRSLDQIVTEGLALDHLAAWLYPGDLFHQRSSIEDRNAMAAQLQRAADAAPVLIVPGNHDAPGDLDIFRELKAKWPIIVQNVPAVVPVTLATGDTAAVAMLPYPTKAGLVSAGVAHDDIVLTAADALEAIFMNFAAALSTLRVAGAIPLFMGHVNVANSITSSGQPNVGVEIEIDRAMLQRLPVQYAALNHIHVAQAVGCGVFAGSIAPMNWGEIEAKSYNVVTCERLSSEWASTIEIRPLATAPLYHVEGNLTRDSFTYRVTEGPNGKAQETPATWRGAEVRVRVRFKQSERNTLAMAQVHAEFAEALRLEVEPLAVMDRDVRNPAVALARTLPDKLAAYAGTEHLAESIAAKLALLEHGDQQQILNDVRAQLALLEGSGAQKATVAA